VKKLEVQLTRSPDDTLEVGTLAEDRGRVFFEYSTAFLTTSFNLSPLRLPFEAGLYEHKDRDFGPLPGLFDDSLPDGWGLLLMDRQFRSMGLKLAEVSALDRLAWLGTRTMGALTYHPHADDAEADDDVFDLQELSRNAQEVLAGTTASVLPQLLRAGGSPGGARPKVLVGYHAASDGLVSGATDLPAGYEHWLVKFSADLDLPDTGAIEYAYALMAGAAGINLPPVRLFETSSGDRFFGSKRFDRIGRSRRHVHTFGNLIQTDFRIPSADYADLLKVTSVLTRNHQDVRSVFRRMVFNVLAHNRDDHVKNFCFVLDDETAEWSLSPAYDLVHSPGPGGEHSMTVNGEGRRPRVEHMMALAEKAGITRRAAADICQQVQAAVADWEQYADRAGVSRKSRQRIGREFLSL